MDNLEAREILRQRLDTYRGRPHAELVKLLGEPRVVEARGTTGASYQLEVEVRWNHQPGGALRVIGSVDDGGLSALKPITDDFIMGPDGVVVDE